LSGGTPAAVRNAVMITDLTSAEAIDRGLVMSLLERLIANLDAPHSENLGPLLHACDAALEAALEAARAHAREPSSPDGRELAWLVELLLTAEPRSIIGVLRQIRRVLGRIDACAG